MANKVAVPFTRELRKCMSGKDVKAVKRALVHQGVLKQKLKDVTNHYGDATAAAVKQYKERHDIKPVDGKYTKDVHRKLVQNKHFDKYGAMLMNAWHSKPTTGPAKGKAIAAAAMYAYSKRPRHYTQGGSRWQPVDRVPWQKHMWDYGDCSSFATGCFKMAGMPDPNNLGYRAGYTGTLCKQGKVVTTPEPGDLIFYGSGAPWTHVAVYVGNGRVVSHGSEGGPFLVPFNYRSDRGQIRRYT